VLSVIEKVVRNPAPLAAGVGDELVMLDPERGEYYGLDAVSTRIWELIAEPRTVGDLCTTLTSEFEVDDETCRNEVIAFLEQLAEVDLVRIDPWPA
jgi:hypothetical protein